MNLGPEGAEKKSENKNEKIKTINKICQSIIFILVSMK